MAELEMKAGSQEENKDSSKGALVSSSSEHDLQNAAQGKNETIETMQVGLDDTLTSIAFQRQMSLEVLKRINRIGDTIYPGQLLKVYKKRPPGELSVEEPKEVPKTPSPEKAEISDAEVIYTDAARTYQSMLKPEVPEEKIGPPKSSVEVSMKGTMMTVKSLEEEKKADKVKDSVDIVLDNLRRSNTFKCDASYMTMVGEVKGSFIVSPYFLVFDPELSEENKHLIPSASHMSRFQCFIDTSDITECLLVVLPSPDAMDDSQPEYYDDYYAQIMLSSVEGTFGNSPKKPEEEIKAPSPEAAESKKAPIATIHFKLGFREMDKVPNQLRKRIALIVTEKLNTYSATNKGRKHNLSSTYVPYYDKHIVKNPSIEQGASISAEKVEVKYVDRSLKLQEGMRSEILTEQMLSQLGTKISPLMRMRPWEVVFRIGSDGVSLLTFYSKLQRYNPTILVVQTSTKCVFGAFVSEPWKLNKHFYGTGESFLYTFKNPAKIETYRWTGANDQIIYSDNEKIAVGGGKRFGLVVEDNFLQGRTGKCETFGNEPLGDAEEFHILNFEVLGLEYLQSATQ